MWVWIPRYAYKITEGYHTNTAGTINVAFLSGTSSSTFLNGESGTITSSPSSVTYSNNVQQQWLVHPAFTSNASNGGGFGELTGIWVAKFETSGTNTASTGYKVKAGVESLRNTKTEDFYYYAMRQTFGETETSSTKDGSESSHTSFGNCHQMKDSEWGAVVYLSYSKYGTNKMQVAKNTNYDYFTGGTDSESSIYSSSTYYNQSTTLNAYGVYDLNGGADE